MAESTQKGAQRTGHPELKREIGLVDLTLFYVVSGISLRWIAAAAASGPSSIVIWILAWFGLFVPLAACVLELSSRFPEEGGLYVWAREAFGDFAGFISAWTYWMSNLPYFSAVLYFAAGCSLFVAGPRGAMLASESSYFMTFLLVSLGVVTLINVRGLKQTTWMNNAGAIGMLLPLILLIILGLLAWFRSGTATAFTVASMSPHVSIKNAIFWSTIFFAFSGVECGSFMGGEIKNPRRTVPKALIFAGVIITLGYVAGTIAMLIAMPSSQIDGLGGFMTALVQLCRMRHLDWIVAVAALLVTLSSLGAACAYLASCSRLPFVAGIDNYLPPVFARIHPRWNTPYVAVLFYGLAGMIFAFLSQAATTVKGAYDVLVSMSIITMFIPYLFLFGAMIVVQKRPASADVIRVPGGPRVAIPLAMLGFTTTLITIGLSVLPAEDEPNKPLAVFKVVGLTFVLVAAGIIVYALGKRRQARLVQPVSASANSQVTPWTE